MKQPEPENYQDKYEDKGAAAGAIDSKHVLF